MEMAMNGEKGIEDEKLKEFMDGLDLRDNKIALYNKLQKMKG